MPVLFEYGSIDLDLTRTQADSLQRTGFVTVSPAPADRWRVTATSHVGTLSVAGIELLIRPKIDPENLFLFLEPGLPPTAWQKEAFDYDATSDLLPAFIAFFARTTETVLGRGVLRSYRARQEPLIALRGRLDLAGQFTRAGVLTPIACTYDEYSEDILENRVLRAAIRLALRVPSIQPGERQRLMRQLVALEGVGDVAVAAEDVDTIRMTRLNRHYAPALSLARLLLANLSLSDARGTAAASSFMVDMNDLFQRFVTARLRRELRGRLDVVAEPTVHLGTGRRVAMQPDLVFRCADGLVRYVGDVKYKLTDGARGRSGDYYQLLAYTTAMDLPEGVLIYCRRRDDDVSQNTVFVRNSGKRLVLHAIDLSGAADEVEQSITALADTIVSALAK